MSDRGGDSRTVYSIPADVSFVDALAEGLMARSGGDPLKLMDFTVLLPTRRAVRSLREAFLRLSGGNPILLPRLMPLGDLDEDELSIAETDGQAGLAAGELPPAIGGLRRQLLLTRLVQSFEQNRSSPDQAAQLARELGRLLDQVQTERLSFDGLVNLVPEDYAEHWQITLTFLKILTEEWPKILAEHGALDGADRRNKLLESQTRLWTDNPPQSPIIAAGSTGSIPATADLLALVAALPDGCVVLPGLDRTLDGDDSALLEPTHPQYGMVQLLGQMALQPADVALWQAGETPPEPSRRSSLVQTFMRPAALTDAWRHMDKPNEQAIDGLELAHFTSPEEEALAIALMMRGTLETAGETAALITPDRELARRVAAELRRWDIEIDDSAGTPLGNSPAGAFLRLTAESAAARFSPLSLLAAGKHPTAAGGIEPVAFRGLVRRLEIAALRGPRPGAGLDGIRANLDGEEQDLADWLTHIEALAAPLTQLMAGTGAALIDLVAAHIRFAEALAATESTNGAERLWQGDDGEAAAAFMAELMESAPVMGDIDPGAYPALLDTLMGGQVVRPRYGRHPRLHIWGLLEARLQQADLVILGGLNEGTWPPEVHTDPWMSRPMRQRFGLPLPERRIGLTAHDFAQAVCAPRVVMTRAQRVEGSPTVPARWLMRLTQLLAGFDMTDALLPQAPWGTWQAELDKPLASVTISPPAPRPPVEVRPTRLSVTQVETWMRDPYAIYARHILRLRALDPLDAPPDASDYGILIHDTLHDFAAQFPVENGELPADAEAYLIELGQARFQSVIGYPSVWAFWWPRFLRIAEWFIQGERGLRTDITSIASEVGGRIEFEEGGRPFTLSAIADRIDVRRDGSLGIIDYKTGAPPSKREVGAGFAPQLPLEAVIAEAGGFDGVPAAPVSALNYWRLQGGVPAGDISSAGDQPDELAAEALDGLKALVRAFAQEDTPYEARPRPDAAPKYSDYEHLARVKEWALAGGDGT